MPTRRLTLVVGLLAATATLAGFAALRLRIPVTHPPRPAPPAVPPSAPPISVILDPPSPLKFYDTAREAGLTIPHFNAADGRFRLVETMGSGIGLIDYDADGWLDIYLAQGCPLPRDPTQTNQTAKLYHSNRDGTYTDVTDAAGVGFNGYGEGVAVGDYDGDLRPDLYVSAFGRGALYRNNGDGTFTDHTEKAGVAGQGWATSCAFADLDADGDLDLYVAHYLADTVDAQGNPTLTCKALPGALGYCPPAAFAPEPDALYRNNNDGTFTDVSRESGIHSLPGNGLGLAIDDFDGDGRLDVFVANDQTPNALFRNLGGLRFEEVATAWGLAYNESGDLRAGMGVAAGDYDDDGRIDLLVTNFYEEGSTLYRNAAPGRFAVETPQARLLAPSRARLGFGTNFLDADNDGRLDLITLNGHVNDVRPLGIPYAMPPQIFRNLGHGKFADVSNTAGPYFQKEWLGRAAAFGDLDNDGDTDAVITHLGRPPALLRNDSEPRGHYLRLTLRSQGPGRDPTGARVTVEAGGRTVVRTSTAGTSYLSASDRRILIGLGEAPTIDRLTVHWPSGKIQVWQGLLANQSLLLEEGGEPRPISDAPSKTPDR